MAATVIPKIVRPDSKGRITLGNLASGVSSFKVSVDSQGRLVLEPQVEVPAAEAWLWKNPSALAAVQKGIREAGEGKRVKRESYAAFAQDGEE